MLVRSTYKQLPKTLLAISPQRRLFMVRYFIDTLNNPILEGLLHFWKQQQYVHLSPPQSFFRELECMIQISKNRSHTGLPPPKLENYQFKTTY